MLVIRNESFVGFKRKVESTRAATEAEAQQALATRRANGEYGDDCDDTRADVYPGATEVCDHVDNNCNGLVDEGTTLPRYLDADGDGHGDPAQRVNVCPSDITENAAQAEAGTAPWLVEIGNDCNDGNPDLWHGCL